MSQIIKDTKRRILINASQPEELRVALVIGQHLHNLDIENPGKEQQKSNIYKAKVTRVERSLGAVFADFGAERHGFLSVREIAKEYLKTPEPLLPQEDVLRSQESNLNIAENSEGLLKEKEQDTIEKKTTNPSKSSVYNLPLQEIITEGQELIVQVEKEQRANKGAALTTFISLAGCYLVLMPNNPRAGGISKRIEGDEREEIKNILNSLKTPDGMGIIVRTAGIGRSLEELQWDLDILLTQWQAIRQAANERSAPFLIYQESNLVIRCIRDHLRPDIEEILIDDPKIFDMVYDHMKLMRPDFLDRVKLYNDIIPLFSRFQIESQIESAYQREVKLRSGGSIVIDHTEALTSIDINSAKATKGADIEETALQTNLEAAEEISRQLRLRDLGGLIVIDFIDMNIQRNQREVEQRLRNAMSVDRAKIQLGKISKFGLLEMSRQRLRPALNESIEAPCPRCNGKGSIRNISTMGVNIIRIIEEQVIENNIGMIILELPIEVATFIMNEKRNTITNIELKQQIKIVMVPNKYINIPNYEIKIIKKEDLPKSFKYEDPIENLSKKEITEYDPTKAYTISTIHQTPAVTTTNTTPAPVPTATSITTAAHSTTTNILLNNNDDTHATNNLTSLIKKLWQVISRKAPQTSNDIPTSNVVKKNNQRYLSKKHNRYKNNRKNSYYNQENKKSDNRYNNHKKNDNNYLDNYYQKNKKIKSLNKVD